LIFVIGVIKMMAVRKRDGFATARLADLKANRLKEGKTLRGVGFPTGGKQAVRIFYFAIKRIFFIFEQYFIWAV
jgi:hypothetical protein